MVREIVTLQLGHESSQIGANLWNQLDVEQSQNNSLIDYNTYYTFNRKTNIPTARVLVIDYRNTFGFLLNENQPVDTKTNNPAVEIVNRQTDDDSWSKHLRTRAQFNSKSLIPLTDYWYYSSTMNDNKNENQFDIYPVGQQIFKKMYDQIENSIHYLLESCDSMQSFRCLYDVNTSFSGLFTSIQDYLADECPKKPLWSFAIGDKSSLMNLSLSLIHSISENQMPTIPCLGENDYNKLSLSIHNSLLAPTMTLDLLADRLCPAKKYHLNLFSKIPFHLGQKTLFHYLELNNLFELMNPLACHYFIRGIEQSQLYNRSLYKFNIDTAAEMVSTYLREQYGAKLFSSTNSWTDQYDHMAMITGLFNDDSYSFKFIDELQTNMKKLNYRTLSKR